MMRRQFSIISASTARCLRPLYGRRVAQLLALDHPRKVSKLILASSARHTRVTEAFHADRQEMVEMGYERYVREQHRRRLDGILRRNHMNLIEKYLQVRMANLCHVELYFRHVLARQEHDTSGRLKTLKFRP